MGCLFGRRRSHQLLMCCRAIGYASCTQKNERNMYERTLLASEEARYKEENKRIILKKLFFLFGFVVLSHSCFNQFFYESKRQFFIQGQTDRSFGGFITL